MSKRPWKEEVRCPICLNVAEDAVESVCCHHVFCYGCADGLHSFTCPLCRRNDFRVKSNIPLQRVIHKLSTTKDEEKFKQQPHTDIPPPDPTFFLHNSTAFRSIPGLRVFEILKPLAIRPTLTSFKEESIHTLPQNDVITTTQLIQFNFGYWMAELEDGRGFIPLCENGNEQNVYARSLPIERGYWLYRVVNGSIALRSRPDYDDVYRTSYGFQIDQIVAGTHRVMGKHGVVYVRVAEYLGWIFEKKNR